MKHILRLWLAHKLDKLKMKSNEAYLALIGFLAFAELQLTSQEFQAWLQDHFGDQPWLMKAIHLIVFLIGSLASPRTGLKAQEYRQQREVKKLHRHARREQRRSVDNR